MRLPRNLGTILLAVYLILAGLSSLGLGFALLSVIAGLCALGAGILMLINR